MVMRALISVSDKDGIVPFAQELVQLGVEIMSTGGTAKALRKAELPVTEVADYTRFPEILGGRVKTLHPLIHGGLLGRTGIREHREEMLDNNIRAIDLLVVNLYPFQKTVAEPDCTLEEAVEDIDIGGPAMIRSAAKNHERVAVLIDPQDYACVIAELRAHTEVTLKTRQRLMVKAFQLTADYDTAITKYFALMYRGV